jgi:hypothetical protein
VAREQLGESQNESYWTRIADLTARIYDFPSDCGQEKRLFALDDPEQKGASICQPSASLRSRMDAALALVVLWGSRGNKRSCWLTHACRGWTSRIST